MLLIWSVCRRLDDLHDAQSVVDDLQLWNVIEREDALLLRVLVSYQQVGLKIVEKGLSEFDNMLDDSCVQDFLNVNTYNGTLYFSKERFEEMVNILLVSGLVSTIDKYSKEFVVCPVCGKPDTEMISEKGIKYKHCLACGAKSPIKYHL